jgi:hypothetical protein
MGLIRRQLAPDATLAGRFRRVPALLAIIPDAVRAVVSDRDRGIDEIYSS